MQAQISEISPVLVQVSVEVPWADVEKAIEGSYITLSRSAKVKGFRQGKVPRNVLKQLFGAKVKHEVVNNLVESGSHAGSGECRHIERAGGGSP
jgi:trigger factor